VEGENTIYNFGKKEIPAANIRFQLVFYRRRISVLKGVLKVESGLV
jgi:hypothetical protein